MEYGKLAMLSEVWTQGTFYVRAGQVASYEAADHEASPSSARSLRCSTRLLLPCLGYIREVCHMPTTLRLNFKGGALMVYSAIRSPQSSVFRYGRASWHPARRGNSRRNRLRSQDHDSKRARLRIWLTYRSERRRPETSCTGHLLDMRQVP